MAKEVTTLQEDIVAKMFPHFYMRFPHGPFVLVRLTPLLQISQKELASAILMIIFGARLSRVKLIVND